MSNFKKGDVVQLKSGGPSMTVVNPAFASNLGTIGVHCQWFDKNKKYEDVFDGESICPAATGSGIRFGRVEFE